ncbi:MAG: hypothetical protein IKI84_01010 [Clostridia bacterium]|nr:hypothetical protein [Clostridia bacterium]
MSEIAEGYIVDFITGTPVRGTPEEIEAVQPFSQKLVEDYGYPVQNIMTHPQYRVSLQKSKRYLIRERKLKT